MTYVNTGRAVWHTLKQITNAWYCNVWVEDTCKVQGTGIPCFIVLCFIVLHRCVFFSNWSQTLHWQKGDDLLSVNTHFIAVEWNQTCNISKCASVSIDFDETLCKVWFEFRFHIATNFKFLPFTEPDAVENKTIYHYQDRLLKYFFLCQL